MRAAKDTLRHLLAQPIAHRGLHACGAPGPVENSLGAAEAAIAAGYAIECDILLSCDGEAMVFHDASLDRLTSASGLVKDHDSAAVRALTLRGSDDHIPTLAELLATIRGRVPLVIEIKTEVESDMRLVDRALAVLEGYAGPAALESFDPRVVLYCRSTETHHPIGLVGPPEEQRTADPAALVQRTADPAAVAACDFLSWSIDRLGDAARLSPSLPRSTWTVRTPAQALFAARHDAQIVFEGFTPSPSINPVAEQ